MLLRPAALGAVPPFLRAIGECLMGEGRDHAISPDPHDGQRSIRRNGTAERSGASVHPRLWNEGRREPDVRLDPVDLQWTHAEHHPAVLADRADMGESLLQQRGAGDSDLGRWDIGDPIHEARQECPRAHRNLGDPSREALRGRARTQSGRRTAELPRIARARGAQWTSARTGTSSFDRSDRQPRRPRTDAGQDRDAVERVFDPDRHSERSLDGHRGLIYSSSSRRHPAGRCATNGDLRSRSVTVASSPQGEYSNRTTPSPRHRAKQSGLPAEE